MRIATTGLKGIAAIILAASCGATASAAEIYKWVDSRGVTHYSDTAPKNNKAERMPDGMGRLSVIPMVRPGAPANQAAPSSGPYATNAPAHGPLKIVEMQTADEKAKLAQWREQCIAERWVDCDDRRALFSRYGTMADGYAPARPLARVR